jgi:hypothetical protein
MPNQSLRQRWRQTSISNKLIAGATVLAAIAAIGYALISYGLLQQAKREHRPRLTLSRLPQTSGPFSCNSDGTFSMPKTAIYVKDTAKGGAPKVYVSPFGPQLVDTGSRMEPITDAFCVAPRQPFGFFSIAGGEERAVSLDAGVSTSFGKHYRGDELFTFFYPVCVWYWDEDGTPYGMCRGYRLRLSNGQREFHCDGSPLSGSYEELIGNYCEK